MKSTIEKLRRPLSLVACVFWVGLAAVTDSRWSEHSFVGIVMLCLGCLFTGIGMIGRVWCLSYIAGHKNVELVTAGPYSLCRNPLYFFSLVGAVGVGLGSITVTLPLAVIVSFMAFYPFIVKSESARLAELHGAAYSDYCRACPALIPSRKNFHETDNRTIQSRAFRNGLGDTVLFAGAFALMHAFHELHHFEALPIWAIVP